MDTIALPTAKAARLLKSGAWRYETSVNCGALAAMDIKGEWFCIHRPSGRQVGNTCKNATAAVLFAGALLAMHVDWTVVNPTFDQATALAAQSRIEALL